MSEKADRREGRGLPASELRTMQRERERERERERKYVGEGRRMTDEADRREGWRLYRGEIS